MKEKLRKYFFIVAVFNYLCSEIPNCYTALFNGSVGRFVKFLGDEVKVTITL